jgi:hypothetical protein
VRIPNREGPDAIETNLALRAPLRISSENNFGVAFRVEAVAELSKRLAKLKVVVNLAIVDNPIAAVSIAHGLPAACRHIDDSQASVAEPKPLGLEMLYPNTIRSTMGKTVGEFAKFGRNEASASVSLRERARPSVRILR